MSRSTASEGASKKPKLWQWVLIGFCALFVLSVIGNAIDPDKAAVDARTGQPVDGAKAAAPVEPPDPYRKDPESALTLTADGKKGGFDSVFILSGTLKNAADFPLKDVRIRCELFAASGTRVGEVSDTLYDIVPAKGQKRFTDLNMGFMGSDQVSNYQCVVKRAVIVDEGSAGPAEASPAG